MSINSAMLAGVSGLTANSAALSAISDNIANVNTVGYKRQKADFESLVTGQATGSDSGGVTSVARQYVSTTGNTTQTTSATDLSIAGQGFFVTTQTAENVQPTDARLFTRAGSFTVDKDGYLQNSAGLYLQGWPVDADGDVTTDPSDLTKLSSINVSTVGGATEPTTKVSFNANLEASQAVSADAASYDASTDSMAMYASDSSTGVKPDFTSDITVLDSQGGKRTLTMAFLKSSTPNQWYAEVYATPASDVSDGTGLSNGQVLKGTVAFTADGRYDAANSTLFADADNPVIAIGASSASPAAGGVSWASSLGIGAQDVTLNLDQAPGGLTQFDAQSAVQSITTNGIAFGSLTGVNIDDDGAVTAVFDNGVTRKIAQVAVATFENPDGLTAVSGNAYRVSNDSGTYNIKAPGAGGAGLLSPSTLEASTVDLSTELTDLITTQRAYSASSKIITTADDMLDTLLSIKR